jgi:hypothetical protein
MKHFLIICAVFLVFGCGKEVNLGNFEDANKLDEVTFGRVAIIL